MSLMMPDGKSWTQPFQNPYASQPQQQAFGRVNSTAQPGQPRPGQGGIPQDAIFRSATPSTGGTKAPDMSAYAPGKAQPVQQQPTGTPYGLYAPGTTAADIAQQPYTDSMQPNPSYAGSARPPATPRFDSVLAADAPWWAGELGNLPHNPADNRPAYGPTGTATGANAGNFQPSAPANPYANMAPGVYYGGQQIPGNQQQALATAMAQRDAMSVLVNNNNLQYQMANAFGQDLGRPQFDYGSAMQQAQNMVANGFYNPFTQYYNQTTDPLSQLGQNAPPSMYNPQQPFPPIGGFGVQQPVNPIQDLFARNNIQTPPGFVDQLISLLGGSAPRSPIPQPPPMSGLPTQPSMGDGLRYVPAEYRDGKLWSDAHYVNDNPPIPEYAPGYGPGSAMGSIGTDLRSHGGDLAGRPVLSPPGYGTDPDGSRMIMDFRDSDRDGVDDRDQPYPGAPPFRAGQAQPIQPPSQGTSYGGSPVASQQDSKQAGGTAKQPPGTIAAAEMSSAERDRMEAIRAQLNSPDAKRALISHGDKARQQGMGGAVQFTQEELQAKGLADELAGLSEKMLRMDTAGQEYRRQVAAPIVSASLEKRQREQRAKDAEESLRRSQAVEMRAVYQYDRFGRNTGNFEWKPFRNGYQLSSIPPGVDVTWKSANAKEYASYRNMESKGEIFRKSPGGAGVTTVPTPQQAAMLSRYATGERGTPGASLEAAIRAAGWKGPLTYTGPWN